MTTEGIDDESEAGPSSSQPVPPSTPKLSLQYFDTKICYASSRKTGKAKIEQCKTLSPVRESPMPPPPEHEKGPSLDIPMAHSTDDEFHASYHIQYVQPYGILADKGVSAVWSAANLLKKSSN